MAQDGKLRLALVDVYGKRLQENMDISLRNLQLTHSPILRGLDASRLINITSSFPGRRVFIKPQSTRSYHPVSHFVNIKTGGPTEMTIAFPVDISKIVSVK